MTKARAAISVTVPAPVGGWNVKDPLDLMPVTDAVRLENFIPETQYVRVRGGFRTHATGMGTGAVQTLTEYADAAGNRKLIACANGRIYDATTYSAAATSLASGFTSNKWQTVNFRSTGGTSILIMVNGVDAPQRYDGSAVASLGFTGPASVNNWIGVTLYRDRVVLLEKDTCKIWYGATGSLSGTTTALDFGPLLKRGGYVQAIATWTRDTGAASVEQFVIISSTGETLFYTGDFSGASNFQLAGRFFLPPPLGRRPVAYLGSETVILTEQGVLPLSKVISMSPEQDNFYVVISDKIADAFIDAAQDYRSNFGWEMIDYSRQHFGIVNVPIVDGVQSQQLLVNTLTGAWCKLTGINASSWSLLNGKPYFGGMDGKVYEWDYGYNDDGAAISCKLKTAFNYFDDRNSVKKFNLSRPVLAATANLTFQHNVDVDFQDRSLTEAITITQPSGADWDAATWDVDLWGGATVYSRAAYSVNGIGRCAAIRLEASVRDVSFNINAFQLTFEPGGVI